MSHLVHLARRFAGSLVARRPDDHELAWIEAQLTTSEWELWQGLARADRRHSLTVARDVERRLQDTPYLEDSHWIAAALLHDVGKLDSGLSTVGRVGATIVAGLAGRRRVASWSARRGVLGRVGRYAEHPTLGAARILATGGRVEAATWAAVHHWPESGFADGAAPVDASFSTPVAIPTAVAAALRAADDD